MQTYHLNRYHCNYLILIHLLFSKDMSEFTLYWNIISQPSRAVKSLIDIGKLPCSFENVSLIKQEQQKKDFTDMYPIGKVPVMKSGNFVLGESGAIMIYLCERYPHIIKYYGETLEQRAITNQYISWYQNYFRPFMVAPMRLLLTAAVTKQPIYEHQKKTHVDGLLDVMEKFNKILTKNKTKFIAGERVTIADLLFFHEMTNMIYLGLGQQKWPLVKQWYADVYNIPEVKKIIHQWFQSAKNLTKMIESVEVIKAKL